MSFIKCNLRLHVRSNTARHKTRVGTYNDLEDGFYGCVALLHDGLKE